MIYIFKYPQPGQCSKDLLIHKCRRFSLEEGVTGFVTVEGYPRRLRSRAEETGRVMFGPDEGPKAQRLVQTEHCLSQRPEGPECRGQCEQPVFIGCKQQIKVNHNVSIFLVDKFPLRHPPGVTHFFLKTSLTLHCCN